MGTGHQEATMQTSFEAMQCVLDACQSLRRHIQKDTTGTDLQKVWWERVLANNTYNVHRCAFNTMPWGQVIQQTTIERL